MLLANKGAGMFGHQDVLRTSSWQAQVRGAKKWFICAPDQKQYLYHAGNVMPSLILPTTYFTCLPLAHVWFVINHINRWMHGIGTVINGHYLNMRNVMKILSQQVK
jgi:hypothetical protein